MAAHKRSDYGRNPHEGASRNDAKARGWGDGWPNAQTSRMARVEAGGVVLWVRREVAPLVETLIRVTEKLGYNVRAGATWGFANRPIRGTRTASNHSWGLAVDLNSDANPMQATFRSDLPPAVVKAWEASGWYWGGRYTKTPDTMHFEYLGRPGDVAADLRKARAFLADEPKAPAKKAAPAKSTSASSSAGPKLGRDELRRGSRNGDVATLQRFVGVDDDGIFGEDTEKAVKRWQMIRGYPRTGVVTAKQGATIKDALD